MTIPSVAIALSCMAAMAAADTRVAVIEIGSSKTVVRRANNASSRTSSPNAIRSFWQTLHDPNNTHRRSLAAQGLSVVGDIFNRPDEGIVVGVSSTPEEIESMSALSMALREDIVGDMMTIPGSQSATLLEAAANTEGMKMIQSNMDTRNTPPSDVDEMFSRIYEELKQKADSHGKTFVLHIVLDHGSEDSNIVESRRGQRQLANNNEEEAEADNDGEEYYEAQQQKEYGDGFYGYGYVNENGEYVVVSKTIFQIQYFQTVLWTAIGMAIITYFCFSLTLNMPFMPDTMLFGESAKMVGA